MRRSITHGLALGLLLIGGSWAMQPGIHSPLMAVAHADDSDNGDNGDNNDAGSTLSPDLQWRLVSNAWDKREFDDAAVLGLAFADANPDHPYALEALWRAYSIYHGNRPNPDKAKAAAEKLNSAASKWLTRYQASDKERAASALWYQAMLFDSQGQRDAAIATFQQLSKKYPGTSREPDSWWYPAEWDFQAQRWEEAIPEYEGYRKAVGITEYGALSVFREAQCYEGLKDKANAIETYKIVFDPKYNWAWGQMGYGAIDAARHLLVDGAPDVSRQMAMGIVDKSPTQGWAWPDLQNQARALLGEAPAKNLFIQPYLYNHYTTTHQDIDGSSKVTLNPEPKVLVSVRYASATDAFHGVMTFAPKVDMKTVPAGLTKVDGDKTTYTLAIDSPDAKGNLFGDQWYGWMEDTQEVAPPANLVLTRKWEKEGSDWGNCTIRIQSSDRWSMMIYLPNTKTNPNNANIQPNEVRDNGATFYYYNWYDQTQGMTIKFPIEVGTGVTEYYPKVYLWEDIGRGPDISTSSADAKDNVAEYDLDIKADKAFPSTFNHPVHNELTMDEISK